MHTIEVDENVYQYLEGKVQGFGDTPNVVLRRLLGIGIPKYQLAKSVETKSHQRGGNGRKAPKASLIELVRVGDLSDGQPLFLHDYRGIRVDGVQAKISGNDLIYNGQIHSMSSLAREQMKIQGYDNDSYRGPEHWFTEKGQSVKYLWEKYLHGHIE